MVRDYQYQQHQNQQYAQRRQQQIQRVNQAVSINDVVSLAQSGVSDSLIINQIRANGVRQKIGVREIISMHQNGVSEVVINEMQKTPLVGTAPQAVAVAQPVVIDRRPVVVNPPREIIIEQYRPIPYHRGPTYSTKRPTQHRHYNYRR